MFLSWFNAGQSRDFGTSLAMLFIEKLPAKQKLSDKEFAVKTQKTLARASLQIAAFKAKCSLNIYKKAQLGNAFKWTLREAEVDPDYIDKLTKWLMLQLS